LRFLISTQVGLHCTATKDDVDKMMEDITEHCKETAPADWKTKCSTLMIEIPSDVLYMPTLVDVLKERKPAQHQEIMTHVKNVMMTCYPDIWNPHSWSQDAMEENLKKEFAETWETKFSDWNSTIEFMHPTQAALDAHVDLQALGLVIMRAFHSEKKDDPFDLLETLLQRTDVVVDKDIIDEAKLVVDCYSTGTVVFYKCSMKGLRCLIPWWWMNTWALCALPKRVHCASVTVISISGSN